MRDIGEATGGFSRLQRLSRDLGVAAHQYRANYFQILGRALRLRVQRGFSPRDALKCGLLDPSLPREIEAACIPKRDLVDHQRRFNPMPWAALTEDKAVFYLYCAAMNLPTPTLHAVFDMPIGWSATGEILRERKDWERFFDERLPDEFVVKPAEGAYGFGLSVYRRTAEGFQDANGVTRTPTELYEALRSDASYRRFVIQEKLYNHADLAGLSDTAALQTVRVVTWIGADGEVEIYDTFLKIIVGTNTNDNFDSGRTGNLIANISLEDGTLGPALGADGAGIGFTVVNMHPKTALAISGFQLPNWREARQLVCRAARLFLPLRTIGWDVALTPKGPMLVEGNIWWDPSNRLAIGPQALGVKRGRTASLFEQFTNEIPHSDLG